MKFNGLKFKSIQGFIMTAVMSLISMLCIGLTIIGYNIAHMGNIVAIMALLFLGLGCVISYLIARQISKPLKQVVDCLTQIATGNLESDVGAVALARADEIGELGTVAQSIAADLRKKAAVARQIAEGNFNIQLPLKSERDILTQDFNIMTSNLQQVFSDINRLTEAAIAGNLAARADTTKHSGDYRKILAGVNAFLEVITVPFNDAEEVLQKMAVNDYTLALHPEKYQGVINQFAANINMVRNRLLNLQEALVQLAKGDTGMLAAYRDITKRSENDQILPALKATLRNFTDVIEEANRLVTSAVNGEMEIRGDINRFEGGYRQIVNGFNQVFDAISAPIGEVFNRLLKMASGDLDVQVNGNYQGCHGLLTKALNRTIDSFNEVLGELNSASNQVATGAQQVSKSSRMMSQGAAEQAANIEEITASISEIDTHTKQNATNATKANKLALGAQERATAGNGQMQKMLEAMTAINESSANIFKIIKVIDEIAFQTNILALNAAVEAARAGQYGKGFAVVAEEVRNLAARSASAAKETTYLIESSIQKVEAGTRIANETAQSLNQIVEGIFQTTGLVGEIATASTEQASEIAQVNRGMAQIAQVTQTNTATAEESAAASEELAAQAELLKEMVEKFQLKNNVKHLSEEGLLGKDKSPATNSLVPKKNKMVSAGDSDDEGRVKIFV